MSPSAVLVHQRIVSRLLVRLAAACPVDLEVLPAPLDWRVGPHDVVEPDLVVIERPPAGTRWLNDPPQLCVEVLSPTDRRHDTVRKRLLYERYGVPGYWIIDPAPEGGPTLLALELVDGQYQTVHDSSDTFEATQPFPVAVEPARLLD